ncbi:DUF6348 family protein [Ruminococcus albus]|uniref:Uncharacterized protein n=1 Tax=Ruminococcus albus TaxID=1264 RepID=A0A1H7L2B8_RUMAL|nr:DUF6348 family protein [Ruminococcus albus]SEK93179.1 hypothetical protein SAMN05216469_10827 [Ruminococcus albus]
MGLFDRFKPTQSDEMRVFERLAGKNKKGIINNKDNSIYFEEYKLKIFLSHCGTENIGDRYSATLFFRIDNEDFEEPIYEPSVGLGTSKEEALDRASDQFVSVMLSVVLSFQCDDMSTMKNRFDGREHIYKYPCSLPVTCQGNGKSRSKAPLDIVKDELQIYLGARKYTWVKLFVGRTGSEVSCEARVNGLIVPELSDKLKDYAEQDEDKTVILMEKQCILFVQDDKTFRKLRYKPEKVKEYALQAIPVIANIHDDKSWDEGFKKINSFTHDYLLTQELINFIPEIVALSCFSYIKHTSDITLNIDDNETIYLKKHQLTAWCSCEVAVEEMLSSGKVDDKFLGAVMHYCSSYYNLMCDLFSKYTVDQIKGGNICFRSLTCSFPLEYKDKIY